MMGAPGTLFISVCLALRSLVDYAYRKSGLKYTHTPAQNVMSSDILNH